MEIVLTKSAEFDAIVAEENEPNGADSADYNGVISYSLFSQYNLYIARLFVTGHQAICSPDRLLSCKGSCTSPRCTLSGARSHTHDLSFLAWCCSGYVVFTSQM